MSESFTTVFMVEEGNGQALFKPFERHKGKYTHGKVVAQAILLAASNNLLLPHLRMPIYLWTKSFDKIYDWYCDSSIFTELCGYLPQHIKAQLEKVRYGMFGNRQADAGTVGWDEWSAEMQPLFQLAMFDILYPCQECGNILHDGHADMEQICSCRVIDGTDESPTPTGMDRQVFSLPDLHHAIMEFMHHKVIAGRPGAINLVTQIQGMVMRKQGNAHNAGWSGTLKHVFAKMPTRFLMNMITGGPKALTLSKNVFFETCISQTQANNSDLQETIWGKKKPTSPCLQVEEAFIDFWNSIHLAQPNFNQHLLLKLFTGSSYAGLTGATIKLSFSAHKHYDNPALDVEAVSELFEQLTTDQGGKLNPDKEAAYL